MKIPLKKYRVGELAGFYGISADTVRLYDNKGLLFSRKNDRNNYREFTRDDLIVMDNILRLRMLGFSLADIGSIMGDYGKDEVVECALRLLDGYAAERNLLDRKMGRLEDFITAVKKCDTISVEYSPAFVYKMIEESMENTQAEFDRLELDTMPYFSLYFPAGSYNEKFRKDFNDTGKRAESVDYYISQTYPHGIRNRKSVLMKGFQVFDSRLCVHAVIRCGYPYLAEAESRIFDFADKHNFRLTGELLRRSIYAQNMPGRQADYFEYWFPVQDEGDAANAV